MAGHKWVPDATASGTFGVDTDEHCGKLFGAERTSKSPLLELPIGTWQWWRQWPIRWWNRHRIAVTLGLLALRLHTALHFAWLQERATPCCSDARQRRTRSRPLRHVKAQTTLPTIVEEELCKARKSELGGWKRRWSNTRRLHVFRNRSATWMPRWLDWARIRPAACRSVLWSAERHSDMSVQRLRAAKPLPVLLQSADKGRDKAVVAMHRGGKARGSNEGKVNTLHVSGSRGRQ